MWSNLQCSVDLITFTEEILNRKFADAAQQCHEQMLGYISENFEKTKENNIMES